MRGVAFQQPGVVSLCLMRKAEASTYIKKKKRAQPNGASVDRQEREADEWETGGSYEDTLLKIIQLASAACN